MTERDDLVIAFRDVHLAFDRPILAGVSFDVPRGSTKIVLGGSGSGKTTLLRLILGLLKPDAGEVRVNGVDVSPLSEEELREIRLNVGMVFQEGALFDSMTVGDNVGYRLREDRRPPQEVEARVNELLGFVGLGTLGQRMPSELSGGLRRRVALARALASRPRIMLYDEPTTGLDPIISDTINELINRLREESGVTSVVVTHIMRDAYHVADTLTLLREGELIFDGTPEELKVIQDPYIQEFIS
jgi:phospholipid/cholesterol/gamma-HCH transport system ATP-binding protein